MLFDQDEIEAWLKQGRIEGEGEPVIEIPGATVLHQTPKMAPGVVDISSQRVYHRNARYR